jgi:hypothetical protein
VYFQSQFGLFQQALLNSARCKCPGRFQATGDAVFLFRLRNDLIDRIAGSERSHGLGGHGIDIPFEVLQNAQYIRFKIVIGHVGPLKAPLTPGVSRDIEPTALPAKGHTPVTKEVFALPSPVATTIDTAALHVYAKAVLAAELVAVVVLKDGCGHAGVVTRTQVVVRV